MSRKEVVQLIPGDKVIEQDVDHIVIERQVPILDYTAIEGNFKHLQGQILTVIEATTPTEKLEATKSIIKGYFNDKLTWMFDLYGHTSEQELPAYFDTGEKIKE